MKTRFSSVRVFARRHVPRGLPIGLLALTAVHACAQSGGARGTSTGIRSLSVVPSVSLTQTFTDNGQPGSGPKRADSITQGSVGVSAFSGGGRVRGFFDYTLSGTMYARQSDRNQLQNSLKSHVTAEVIENRAFIDASGSISQQSISAFGTQTPVPGLANSNSTEVANFSVSPYVRGALGGFAEYQARLNYSTIQSRQTRASDATTTGGSVGLSGGNPGRGVGWGVNMSHQTIDFKERQRPSYQEDLLNVSLTHALSSQFRVGINGGVENSNYTQAQKRETAIRGVSFEWNPSDRTQLSAGFERRSFGNTHNLQFLHRTPRTIWTLSDSRTISTGIGANGIASLGNAYDLVFQQFSSREPDPIRRAALTDEYLRVNGIPRDAQIISPFQIAGITLQRLQQISFAILGLRNTLTFAATQSHSERLDTLTVGNDLNETAKRVRLRGASASLSHQFTPLSSGIVTLARQNSYDLAGVEKATSMTSLSTTWTTRLSRSGDLLAGLRYTNFDGATPYTERAVFASLRLSF